MYQRKDSYYRRAKAAGLRSRAAFKLEDVAGGLIRRGSRIADLGSWPGGWLQAASHMAGVEGIVVGVDLRPVEPLGLRNVRVITGDVGDPATLAAMREALGGPADVVLSDMAPQLTGVRVRDEVQAEAISFAALAAARELLRAGGNFVCKTFMGGWYRTFLDEVRRSFATTDATRPPSTRKGSAELYVVARGFRPSSPSG